jgi:hypothetical protein
MKTSQIREILLAEHAHLRERMDDVRSVAVQTRGRERRIALRAAVERLAHELHEHTLNEERILRGLLRSVDAWGPVREEIMDQRHLAEHRELAAAAVEAIVVSDASVESGILSGILDRILEHMAVEEVVLLGDDVMGDHDPAIDQFTG